MRIRLNSTSDPFTKLKRGDMGTVLSEKVDTFGDTVYRIQWDSGSTLSLIDGVDDFTLIPDTETVEKWREVCARSVAVSLRIHGE